MRILKDYFQRPAGELPEFNELKKQLFGLMLNTLATSNFVELFKLLRQFDKQQPSPTDQQIYEVYEILAGYLVEHSERFDLKQKATAVVILVYLGYRFPNELEKHLMNNLRVFLTFTREAGKVTPNQVLGIVRYGSIGILTSIGMRNWIFTVFQKIEHNYPNTLEG